MGDRRSTAVRSAARAAVTAAVGAALCAALPAATAGARDRTPVARGPRPRAATPPRPRVDTAPGPRADTARVLSVRDEGRLRFVRASGSVILDEGSVSGTFPGYARVRFLYDGEPEVRARFTISGRGGSVSAEGTGRLSSPTSASPSFSGAMTITGGSGRYAHIHGGGKLFGVYYRRSYGLIVQAIGDLPY